MIILQQLKPHIIVMLEDIGKGLIQHRTDRYAVNNDVMLGILEEFMSMSSDEQRTKKTHQYWKVLADSIAFG